MYNLVSRTRCSSLLYQLPFCTVLLSCPSSTASGPGAWERTLLKITNDSSLEYYTTASCVPRVINNTWKTVPAAHLTAKVTAGGILGDTINGPDWTSVMAPSFAVSFVWFVVRLIVVYCILQNKGIILICHCFLYSQGQHKDVSVNDGPHIRRWSHNIIIPLCYNCLQYSVQ